MDSAKFQEAQRAYDAGDYRSAAKGFLAAAGKGAAVGNGAAFHLAGNSLMRLRRHADAVRVYQQALRDEAYDRRGAVFANLGAAYTAIGDLSEAVGSYEAALVEPDYVTPYKAWQGIGGANMERGKAEDAAVAYRKAALDEKNPDPGKSLVNLGLCFMALGRPSDAIDAYRAALGFENYGGRGKALANLGQAYFALGDMDEAVRSFEKATRLHGHTLSEGARKAYETALESIAPKHETIDGWETGEMPPADVTGAEPSGWQTGELAAMEPVMEYPQSPSMHGEGLTPSPAPGSLDEAAAKAASALGMGDDDAVRDFFSVTEEEMKRRAREARRGQRGSSRSGLLRAFVTTVVVGLLLGAAGFAGYYFGLGWPEQSTTVKGLFTAYSTGQAVEDYWVAVPGTDIKREMAKVPPVKEFVVDSVERGRETSKARVTVTPEKGAPMHYIVTLGREGVGWRVTGVDYNWRSTGG